MGVSVQQQSCSSILQNTTSYCPPLVWLETVTPAQCSLEVMEGSVVPPITTGSQVCIHEPALDLPGLAGLRGRVGQRGGDTTSSRSARSRSRALVIRMCAVV